jgi:type VI secretion system secreted protein VgrG
MPASLSLKDVTVHLECMTVVGRERLGEASAFEVVVVAAAPLDVKKLVGTQCALRLDTLPLGERMVRGIVWSVTSTMASSFEQRRAYRIDMRSIVAVHELRRESRVFQHKTAPAIVKDVLCRLGYADDQVELRLTTSHPPLRYVTQYDETCGAFVRRMCEEAGLFFLHEDGEDKERIVILDASHNAPEAFDAALLVEDRAGSVIARHLRAWGVRDVRARRAGKMTLRAFDPMKPTLPLEGSAEDGVGPEREIEIYHGAAPFLSEAEGKKLAALRLEAERATARVVTFETNATSIFPGAKCTLTPAKGYTGAARPNGEFYVVALEHAWQSGDPDHTLRVEAIPLQTPFRLPRVTPRPRALGVHTAFVTGPAGQEIHTDAQGRVFVRFLWNRESPGDETSSLPVRVMQASMPGSMGIPRIGWEVQVMFEDGDPDRPFVLGHAYNGRTTPPVPLPANKTMTALQTWSSPGGNAINAVTYDDAAGRQHMKRVAAKSQTVTVAHDAHVNTAKVDNHTVGGNLSRSVGAEESVTVKQAFFASMASQTANVGANQDIYVKGKLTTGVDSETVTIGAALLEQVGNPVTGVTNLATAAALQGIGAIPGVGPYLSAAGGVGLAAYQGYKAGGAGGAAQAAGMAGLGIVAGMVPGGEALLGSVQAAASPAPWRDTPAEAGAARAGGGAGGDEKDHAAAQGPGPGHRDQIVKGAMTEAVGGSFGIVTPGTVGWKTTGISTFLVGGSHATKTRTFTQNVTGASTETLGSLHVKSDAKLQRIVSGTMHTTISGALSSKSDGPHLMKVADKLSLKVGGSLDVSGSVVVFKVGSSKVVSSPGGVLVEASTITITGDSSQSSKTSHQ